MYVKIMHNAITGTILEMIKCEVNELLILRTMWCITKVLVDMV